MQETFEKRWYRVMNRALELNREVPWIYSDTWMGLVDSAMLKIWEDRDEERLQEMEEDLHLS